MTDYFGALLLRHAAVSEDLAGDPFTALQDPFAVAPPDRDAAAFMGDGPRPLTTAAPPPVAGRPAGPIAPPSPPSPGLASTPRQPQGPTGSGERPLPARPAVTPAVTGGLAATMLPGEPPLTTAADAAVWAEAPAARAAIASHSVEGWVEGWAEGPVEDSIQGWPEIGTASAPPARPPEVPPPNRPVAMDGTLDAIASAEAEAASVPPHAPRAEAAGHGRPLATARLHVMLEGDRTPVPAATAHDGAPEPTRQGVVAAPVPGPSRQGLPVPEDRAARECEAIMPAADPATRGPLADHEGATLPAAGTIAPPRRDLVAHGTGPVFSLDRATNASDDSAAGHHAPEASASGILLPPPHGAGRDPPPTAAAASPETASSAARPRPGRQQDAMAASPAPSAAQDAAGSRVPTPYASPEAPQQGVRVSIDRLELRAASPAPARPAPARPAPAGRRIGLDDYAARRHRGAGS